MRPHVVIVSSSDVLASLLQRAWVGEAAIAGYHLFTGRDLKGYSGDRQPDLALLLPQTWMEMRDMLPVMATVFGSCPWLVLADMRLAGMFVTKLKKHPCTFVGLGGSRKELQEALVALPQGKAPSPSDVLRSYYSRGVEAMTGRAPVHWPLIRELEYGFAASFGLTNLEIGEFFGVTEGTAKSELHALFGKVGVASREALTAKLTRVFAPSFFFTPEAYAPLSS